MFIDLKASYDSVERNDLWLIMDEHGCPTKLVRIVLNGSESSVQVLAKISTTFDLKRI